MPSDTDDQGNPLAQMMPPANNPEYHRRKAAFIEDQQSTAEAAVLDQFGHMSENLERVRKNPPQAQAPQAPVQQPAAAPLQDTEPLPPLPTQESVTQAPPAAPQAPVEPPSKDHPILGRLRRNFGLDSVPMVEVPIGDQVFTMRVLELSAVSQALRFADTLTMTPRENAIMVEIGIVSFSVIAIDGVPLWEVFDAPIPDADTVVVEGARRPTFKPMDPPASVRLMGATALMDFLNTETTTLLASELWKAYTEKVDPAGDLGAVMARLTGDDAEEELTEDIPLPL